MVGGYVKLEKRIGDGCDVGGRVRRRCGRMQREGRAGGGERAGPEPKDVAGLK